MRAFWRGEDKQIMKAKWQWAAALGTIATLFSDLSFGFYRFWQTLASMGYAHANFVNERANVRDQMVREMNTLIKDAETAPVEADLDDFYPIEEEDE